MKSVYGGQEGYDRGYSQGGGPGFYDRPKYPGLVPLFQKNYAPVECDGKPVEDSIGDVIGFRANALRNTILVIKLSLEDRKNIHTRIVQSLDALIIEARNRVLTIKDRKLTAKNPEMVRRRTLLEENINFMENQKLLEEVQFWKDKVELQKDLNELLEEERTISLVSILEQEQDNE